MLKNKCFVYFLLYFFFFLMNQYIFYVCLKAHDDKSQMQGNNSMYLVLVEHQAQITWSQLTFRPNIIEFSYTPNPSIWVSDKVPDPTSLGLATC